MKVAKQINDTVVIDTINNLYPHISFADDGSDFPDFIVSEGLYHIDNALPFDPITQKLVTVAPYIDGTIARTVSIAALTTQEIAQMTIQKSGQVIDIYKATASQLLDEFAQSRGYDNIISLTTYINDPNPDYVAEANRGIYLRSVWWTTLTAIMNDVLSGTRVLPASWEELQAELPELSWDSARHA